jgi:hypothetical protein
MQRSPDAVPLWKSVAAWHHADDRDRRAADANDAADGVCRAAQLVFPEIVSDHHDLVCVAPFIGFQQRASHQRRNARQRKGRRGHVGDGLRLTGAGADGDGAFFHIDRAKIGDRAETVAPQLVITARCGDPRIVEDVPVPHCNDRLAVRKRNRRPERLSRDLEPDGADGDRERYGNRRDHGERRMLDQHAAAEPEVEHREPQTVEGAQPASLPSHILIVFRAAELEPRLTRGLSRRHAGTHEIRGAQLHVQPELLVHLRVDGLRPADTSPERTRARDDF